MFSIIKTVLFSLVFFISATVFGQNSESKADPVLKWKVGVYKTEKEFVRKSPSDTKPFFITPVYSICKTNDSVIVGYKYNYGDSSFRPRNYYGLYDGKDFYLRVQSDLLQKFDHLGKYPFITLRKGKAFPASTNLGFLAIGLADKLMAGVNEEVWYFNKNGTFLQAKRQAMFFLLADEKDLLTQFVAEKVNNNEIFRKYLLKMNDRYSAP